MTFVAVPIALRSAPQVTGALERAKAAEEKGAAIIEWRIDALATEAGAADAALHLLRDCPLPCILTCRLASEGGEFTGRDSDRAELFTTLLKSDFPPRYIDIELRAFRESPARWRRVLQSAAAAGNENDNRQTSLILSSHDFNHRPANLLQQIEAMINEPACSIIKIAWQARSLRDNLEVFDLLAERKKPMVAMCMGQFGLMSRLLAPKFGGFICYASLEPGEESALGQPTLNDLNHFYPWDRIGPKTQVYGIIGWPTVHSLSPIVHNAGFQKMHWDGVFLPLPIPGGAAEYEHFKATVGELTDHSRLSFRGASVTMPHKTNLLRFVSERGGRIDPVAEIAGAANTLIVGSTGAIACRNTDAPAIVDSLCDALNVNPDRLKDIRIAILGAGGVARAALAGLLLHGPKIVIFNRTKKKAQEMVEQVTGRARSRIGKIDASVGDADDLRRTPFDVYVNCTSIGMAGGPAPDRSPLEVLSGEEVPLDESVTVFDTVYSPPRTPLVTEAESRGARVVLGIDMFLRQAALQFESWTGEAAPVDAFRNALQEQKWEESHIEW